MSKMLGKFFGKKGTRSAYGKEEDKRVLPTPVQPVISVTNTSNKDKQKEDEALDTNVEQEQQHEDTDANTDVRTARRPPAVVNNVTVAKEGTSSASAASGTYQRLWSPTIDYTMAPIRYSSSAFWVPNFIPFYPIIVSCARLVGQSNHVMKHEQQFNPYAFATGIYYLGMIQILRAQKASGELLGLESSALARFIKYNPLESIMIPEPFIPLFESIVATETEDNKYSWITPTHGFDFTGGKTLEQLCGPSILDLIRPNILFMLGNLATFGATSRATLITRMPADNVYTPVDLEDNTGARQAVQFINAARTFDGAFAAANANDVRNVLQMQGANMPFQFWNQNWLTAHEDIRNSNFFTNGGINFALTENMRNPEGTALAETITIRSLDQYLFLAKENNPSWFHNISENINLVARFFPGSKPFSKIAVTGGMESTMICQLKTEPLHGTRHVYEDMRLGRTDYNQISFYRNRFTNLTGSFRTARVDIDRNEELTALTLGMNANPPVNFTATELSPIRRGRIFTDDVATNDETTVKRLGFMETTTAGEKPMYIGWHDNYVKPAFSKKPTDA